MGSTEKKQIYIVIPAYNEEKNISQVLESLLKFDYHLVVVDDGSFDKTYEKAKKTFACAGLLTANLSSVLNKEPNKQSRDVKILRHKINRGQGAALQTGTDYAIKNKADIIVHFDGDGQFLPSEIQQVVEPILSKKADIVLGSRFLTNKKNNKASICCQTKIRTNNKMPFLKRYAILPVAKIVNWLLTGIKLTDAHCGFRAMNKLAAGKIRINQDRMSHNTEIVAQIKKHGLKYEEVPVTVIYNEFGQGIGGGFKILKDWFFSKLIKN